MREYDAEAVERVLERGGVEVDMVISEEVRVGGVCSCAGWVCIC